jgi:hypothetical protein
MGNETSSILTCTFCGKDLSKDEIVRYRGALSCKTCAQAQEPVKDFNERPFFLLAALGTLIGLFVVTVSVIDALSFYPMQFDFYVPQLGFYFSGIFFALILQGFGVYALNRTDLHSVAIITSLATVIAAVAQIVAIWDLATNGPYYVFNSVTYTKGFVYYSYATAAYTLFAIAVGLGILFMLTKTKLENTSIAAGGLYLVGGSLGVFGFLWPPFGFLHILMYAVAFVFFFTRKEIVEKEPIETLDYKTVEE